MTIIVGAVCLLVGLTAGYFGAFLLMRRTINRIGQWVVMAQAKELAANNMVTEARAYADEGNAAYRAVAGRSWRAEA